MSPSPSRTVFVALVANIGVVEHDFLLPMSAATGRFAWRFRSNDVAIGTSGNVRPAPRALTSGVMSGAQVRRSAPVRLPGPRQAAPCRRQVYAATRNRPALKAAGPYVG